MIDSSASGVVLVGPPGSGKSSTGRSLAQMLGWRFIDIDNLIEERIGMTVREYFAKAGEPAFRKEETECLKSLIAQKSTALVLATGGGIIITDGNFGLMQQLGKVVCLRAKQECLESRLAEDDSRPLLAPDGETSDPLKAMRRRLNVILSDREKFYALPEHQISTDDLNADEVAAVITKRLQLPRICS